MTIDSAKTQAAFARAVKVEAERAFDHLGCNSPTVGIAEDGEIFHVSPLAHGRPALSATAVRAELRGPSPSRQAHLDLLARLSLLRL